MLKKYNKKSFTLVEILLYLAISSTIITAVSFLFSLVLESRIKNEIILEVEQQGTAAMELITQTIRNSDGINVPLQGSQGFILSLDATTASEDPAIFDVANGKLRLQQGLSAALNLTSSRVTVSDFNVYNLTRSDSPGILKLEFTLTYNSISSKQLYNYSKTFYATAGLR